MFAGVQYGHLDLAVEVHDTAPATDLDAWDACGEAGARLDPSALCVYTPTGEPAPRLPLPATSSLYRLRMSARGRDSAAGRVGAQGGSAALGEHLLQLWPAPYTAGTVLKTDEVSRPCLRLRAGGQ